MAMTITFSHIIAITYNRDQNGQVRRQLEENNTQLLDSMISNISDTLIQRDKASRLRFSNEIKRDDDNMVDTANDYGNDYDGRKMMTNNIHAIGE